MHTDPRPGPGIEARPGAELALAPTRAEDAFAHIRDQLGTVAPREDRIAILARLCDRATFELVVAWLSSTAVESVD